MKDPTELASSVLVGLDARTVFLWSLSPAPRSGWVLPFVLAANVAARQP